MNRRENEKGKTHDDDNHPNKRYTRPPSFIYTGKNKIPYDVVHVVIADNVTSIPQSEFQHRKQLQSVTIPSNVKVIGNSAFNGCTRLRTLHFLPGSQLTTIKHHAFRRCLNLLEVTLPDSILEINCYAFLECENLKKIILPSKLKTIDNHAFEDCYNLVDIILPEGLERIGYGAFSYCRSLTFVEFKGRPDSFDFACPFDQCNALKSVTFPPREQLETAAAIAASNEKPFTFRSLRHQDRGRLDNIGFEPMEASIKVDVVRNNNMVPQHPDMRRHSRYDDFAHYQRLCNTAVERSINGEKEVVAIRSIHLIHRSGRLCGFQVNCFDSSNKNNGPKNQYRSREEDDTSWSLHLKKDEFLIGLRSHIDKYDFNIFGVTFVTNQRQVHWGVRSGRFEPYALMFDDGNTISHRSRIVALAATYWGPTYFGPNNNAEGRDAGLITGIGCYAKRFNWFTNNVGECIYLKWKLKMGHASETSSASATAIMRMDVDVDEDDVDVDDVGVFTNDVVVNLLSRLHDDGFRKVIRFLY